MNGLTSALKILRNDSSRQPKAAVPEMRLASKYCFCPTKDPNLGSCIPRRHHSWYAAGTAGCEHEYRLGVGRIDER
jgi:hypothetical protein